VRGEADAHVPVPAFGHDADLEVVEPTGGRDGVRRPHARRVLMCLAMTWKHQQNLYHVKITTPRTFSVWDRKIALLTSMDVVKGD
jgi:hypothetical protein